jgi:glutaminyl-tRNA synthetase
MQVLVSEKYVRGWGDPRLPTLAGMRRRGMSPEGINTLCQELGITRNENAVHLHNLYHHIRRHLDETSPRALAVLRPLKLVWPPH